MFLRRRKLSPLSKIRHMFARKKGYSRAWHYFVWRLKRLQGTPEFIAKGFAVGIAINYWPILFTHMVLGYIICRIIRGNIIAMFIGTLFGNPWTFAIVYPMTYRIGKALLGLRPTHSATAIDSAEEVWKQIWPIKSWLSVTIAFENVLFPMMIGGFLLALPSAILAYYLVRNGARLYQLQRQRHLRKKFDSVEAEIEQNNPNAQ